MNVEFLLKGIISGFAIAAPVGPTTVLVLHRTVNQSKKAGILSGMGAASADAFFGLLAGLGVGLVAGFLHEHVLGIRTIGGFFLLYWGARIFASKFAESHPLVRGEGKGGPFVSTALLTFTNPMTLIAFLGVLAGLGAASFYNHPFLLLEWIIGICIGSFGWWFAVVLGVHRIRNRFDYQVIMWINRVMGIVIIVAGIILLLGLRKV
jgi:threonine/homoserine/homoserine lactone efflux protein